MNELKKAEALLNLERKIVGIKIVYSKEEFDLYSGKEIIAPMSYCVAVRSATLGHSIKIKGSMSGCGGSTRALGLAKPSEDFYNGKSGYSLGLYCSEELASKVSLKMNLCKKEAYGVIVKPLEQYEKDPDVVLIVSNTRECMRIIQGYTYFYGMNNNFCLTGNQAVCVEATVTPIITNEINISMFCSGTRFLAKWKDYEVIIGIPFNKFSKTVEGIRMTVNAVEPDERKHIISKKLKLAGYDNEFITFGETYYTKLEDEKRKKRGGK